MPCIVTVPSPIRPVPYCSGSVARLIAWLAITRSAVTLAPTGFAVVPICRVPVGMTVRLPTISLVFTVVTKFNVPSISRLLMCALLACAYCTVTPVGISTRSLFVGTRPADQVLAFDHRPLWTAVMVGVVTNRGIVSVSVMIWLGVTTTPPE